MSRFARDRRVFFIEEPVFDGEETDKYFIYKVPSSDVFVLTPHLPGGLDHGEIVARQARLLHSFLEDNEIYNLIRWYYSPMMLAFSEYIASVCTVYDCMDELSAFLFAPPQLPRWEAALLEKADIVFTGGRSLYLAKKDRHHNIHPFPSGIDKQHFLSARLGKDDPLDQAKIPSPRIGFYGVIDERLDIALLKCIALLRPSWQFVLIGPVVKIDADTLPRGTNIHYLGPKTYKELPRYLAGWQIAMMPFALNESTKFISPTKTPEYLAGGRSVISPSIADVLNPYGEMGLVHIADTPETFVEAAMKILDYGEPNDWLEKVDRFLRNISWDSTVKEMNGLIVATLPERISASPEMTKNYV